MYFWLYMPQFLDIYTSQIRVKCEDIRQKMLIGRVSNLDEDLKELVKKNWIPFVEPNHFELEVVAIDGSRAIRDSASGAIFYIARALALFGKKRFRELEVDSFFSKARSTDIQVFVNTKMEWLEYKVAIKSINEANLTNVAILLDGSLYGRLTHLPRDQPAEGMKDFIIDYFKTYYELLELCRDRQILIVGVSKDSRSSFFRNYLLNLLLNDEINSLDEFPDTHKLALCQAFEDIYDNPSNAFKRFRELAEEYPNKLQKIERIFYEAISSRPDHQLIRNFINVAGHTIPIELSFSNRGFSRLEQIENNPKGYVMKYFKETLLETADRKTFIDKAIEVLSKIPQFPTMVSFHILLDRRDTPIRVDTPSWTFGITNKISDFIGSKHTLLDVGNITNLLRNGYSGLTDYNVWLKRVDEEVRLRGRIVDQLYNHALEKLLHCTVIHSRGYRRVKYP